jgi:hypothetical protein
MKSVLFGTILSLLSLTACTKNDNDNLAGRARMKFNAIPAFFGHELYEINYSPATYAYFDTASVGIRRVTVTTVTGTGGADDHVASVFISIPSSLNTINGPITIDFSQPPYTTMWGSFSMGIPGFSYYISKSGILTITKLDYSEIEGFFSCQTEAQFSDEDITVTNGSFAGKFK